ncbi:MAG: RNA 2',3'-cyclic phosphodiesterase [Halioglobus sp.]
MRLFFALDLTPDAKLEIATWRDRSFGDLRFSDMARPVSAGNLHITLGFIGEMAEAGLERLYENVDQWLGSEALPAFDLTLDELGYWQRQGILWLGPGHSPVELLVLARKMRSLAARIGSKRNNKRFQAHVSLFRGCKLAPAQPLVPPAFSLSFDYFSLFESRQTRSGVSYHELRRWELYSAGSGEK